MLALANSLMAQAIVPVYDLGTNLTGVPITPTPGPLDITNFNAAGDTQFPDGLNYYIDNGGGLNSPGQTFTTPATANMVLQSVAVETGTDNGGSGTGPQTIWLQIFKISGTTATPVATYTSDSSFSFLPGDWIQWTGLSVPLQPNAVYAYSLSKGSAGAGYCQAYAGANNAYTDGQICLIQVSANGSSSLGTVTYGGAGTFDANFSIGLAQVLTPVTTPPQFSANPVYGGTPVTISEIAGGPGPLSYQWQTDNGSGGALSTIIGATSTNVLVTPAVAGTYAYNVIVTNISGSVTSSVVNLTVFAPSAPILTQDIGPGTNIYAFANGSVTFNAGLGAGTLPINYQWLANTNGSYVNVGQNTNLLSLSNLQASAAGSYELTAYNSIGSSNSSVSVLSILADPLAPTAAQPYAYDIFTNHPLAYWRLSETNDTILSSMQAYDYSGHNLNANYGHGVADNVAGPQMAAFPGFEADNAAAGFLNGYAGSSISVPSLNLNTNTVTISMWINPNTVIGNFWGLFTWTSADGTDKAGLGFGSTLSGSISELGYTWNTNSSATYNYNSGLYPKAGQWSFVSLVITPTNSTIYLYYVDQITGATNLLKSVQTIANGPEAFSGGTIFIGSDNYDGRNFDGSIDEVAVFAKSLSESQIQGLFLTALGASGVAPAILTQPTSANAFSSFPTSFTVSGGGAPPPTYQWQHATTPAGPWSNLSNGGRISGATSSVLNFSSTLPADGISYRAILANAAGSVTSSPAQLNLTILPTNGLWTVNYAVVNGNNGFPNTVYSGSGILGGGTYWNGMPGYPAASSVSTLLDDGATASGVTLTFVNPSGEWAGPGPYGIPLLYPYVSCSLSSTSSVNFTNVPNGTYNLAVYGIDAGYNDRAVMFTVNGVSQSLINIQGLAFVPNDNTALFTNVVVNNGQLVVNMVPIDSPAHSGNNEGEFNGAQLQLVQAQGNPAQISSVTVSGGNIVIKGVSPDAGSGYRILSTTNLALPLASWTTAGTGTFAGSGFTNTIPVSSSEPQRFYRVVEP
jgi:hypothetical protein